MFDDDGFMYFKDRIGETFRWKGENVATGEVQEAVAFFPGVSEVNVYGVTVPHCEGRCGMAMLTLAGEAAAFDFRGLYASVVQKLPAYARPVFLRIGTGAKRI
jgi:fatty-acyl-CoA synthase